MFIYSKLYLLACVLVGVVLGLDITSNRVDQNSVNLNVGDITIHSGASWSIINNAVTAFVSSLDVQSNAGLYISSTSPLIALQVTMLGLLNSITNDGVISLNSLASLTSSNYKLIGASFTNNGEMYLGASGIIPSAMGITAASWENTGLLSFYQNQRNSGNVNLGAALGTINNNGQICFHNEVYQQTTAIKGTGCITAEEDSTIYITNALLPVSTGQTFYLADGASSMIVQALSTPQTFNVRNFGQVNGVPNKIGLTIPLFAVVGSVWSYDADTGILTLNGAGLLLQHFNIGTGYDATKFAVVTDNGSGLPSTLFGSVQYNGPVPNPGMPSQCRPCKKMPEDPGAEPTEYTTTVTTTTNGHTLTETGVVVITTDSLGSWFTTTSIFTTASASTSEDTTTTSVASVETDSGVVSQSEDSFSTVEPSATSEDTTASVETDSAVLSQSEESLSTAEPSATSEDTTASVETDSGVVSQSEESLSTAEPSATSEYTTTWTTTNSDGSIETGCGIISQSGDSLTTITTFSTSTTTECTSCAWTSTWTTTNADGSVETGCGLVSQSGDSITTITEFSTSTTTECNATAWTSTWTTTNAAGSVETGCGIVSQSGDSLTTLTIFSTETINECTECITSTWTSTNAAGSIETGCGIVSPSGDSLITLTTFEPSATLDNESASKPTEGAKSGSNNGSGSDNGSGAGANATKGESTVAATVAGLQQSPTQASESSPSTVNTYEGAASIAKLSTFASVVMMLVAMF
uniref:Iff01 n=1 Tax=Candida metapsilosis TaxID=273372 RepID=A0A4Y5MTB0_9ASCO|nr:Iff01 [Candida metapsilosis]